MSFFDESETLKELIKIIGEHKCSELTPSGKFYAQLFIETLIMLEGKNEKKEENKEKN